jgi:hypothetical protein
VGLKNKTSFKSSKSLSQTGDAGKVSAAASPAPEPARDGFRHLFAGLLLVHIIVSVYGLISWGMFAGSGDFRGHIKIAQELYDTGVIPVPHFLFHALVAGLMAIGVAPTATFGGRIVIVASYGLTAVLIYGLLWFCYRNARTGHPFFLFLAGLAILVAEPLTLAHTYKLGFLWPEPYQIPTSILLKPFAIASFAFTVWCLSQGSRMSAVLVSLFTLATLAGTLSKPSFIICLLPASFLLLIFRLVRRLPATLPDLLWGLYLPACLVLAWQFYSTYSGAASSGGYHDTIIWAPLKFLHAWATGLSAKFLLSIAFPIVTILCYGRKAIFEPMLQLAWLCFAAGALYTYGFVEKIGWANGNFVWSGYIAAFILFAASAFFVLRQIGSAASWKSARTAALVCGLALALHALSGLRLDWLYLTHYGCSVSYTTAEFLCESGV